MRPDAASNVRVGTAGWSYPDWYGHFYPVDAKTRGFDELTYYCGHFDTVEVNSSFYRIPSPYLVEGWIARTPDDFVFSLKAFSAMTHHFEVAATKTFQEFERAVEPIRQAGKLGAILLQFPPSFRPGARSIEYLRTLPQLLPAAPCVVEFRHSSWVQGEAEQETLDLLDELGLGFCCVDEPRLGGNMPEMAVATGPVGYVRFHGRNYADWWPKLNRRQADELRRTIRRESASHLERRAREQALDAQLEAQKSQRYNYLYTQAELIPWKERIERIAAATGRTFVITNNHFVGQAVANAKMLQDMLDVPRKGLSPEFIGQLELEGMREKRGSPRPAPAGPSGA